MARYAALIFLLAFGFHATQTVRAEETQTSKPEKQSPGLIGSIFGTVQRGIQALGGADNKASNQTQNSTTSSTTSEPENPEESTTAPPLIPDIIQDIGNVTNHVLNDTKDSSKDQPANPLNLIDDILNLTTTALNHPLDLPKQIEDNVAKLVKSLKPFTEQLPKAIASAQDIISKFLSSQFQNAPILVVVSLIFRQVLDMIAKMYNSYMLPLTTSYRRAREVLKFLHLI